jgi:hypothetical protein
MRWSATMLAGAPRNIPIAMILRSRQLQICYGSWARVHGRGKYTSYSVTVDLGRKIAELSSPSALSHTVWLER